MRGHVLGAFGLCQRSAPAPQTPGHIIDPGGGTPSLHSAGGVVEYVVSSDLVSSDALTQRWI